MAPFPPQLSHHLSEREAISHLLHRYRAFRIGDKWGTLRGVPQILLINR